MPDGASVSAFSFQGRISRSSFWTVIAALVVAIIVLGVLAAVGMPSLAPTKVASDGPGWLTAVVGLVYLVAIWISLANYAKRLHDLDHSGWMAVLLFIPLINLILLIYCGAKPGTPGPNRFGPGPMKVGI